MVTHSIGPAAPLVSVRVTTWRTIARRGATAVAIAMLLAACASSTPHAALTNEERTAAWLDAHRHRPPLVRMFLQQMPKGGDIRHVIQHDHILLPPDV